MMIKRKLIAALTAAALLGTSFGGISVFAEGEDAGAVAWKSPEEAVEQFQEPVVTVDYNGNDQVFETVKPKLVNDRVMVPFRQFFELMGAEVTYEEGARKVMAVREEVTVSFSLDGDRFYTTKTVEGKEATTETIMDVPVLVEEDQVLIPLRFAAEAFDVNIQWKEYSRTVYLTDVDGWFIDLGQKAPNISRLLNLKRQIPEGYGLDSVYTFEYHNDCSENRYFEEPGSVQGTIRTQTSGAPGIMESAVTIDLQTAGFEKILEWWYKNELNFQDIKDFRFDFILKGNMLYFQTNFLAKFQEVMPEEKAYGTALQVLSEDTWYCVDLEEALERYEYEDIGSLIYTFIFWGKIIDGQSIRDIVKEEISLHADGYGAGFLFPVFATILTYFDKLYDVQPKEEGGFVYTLKVNNAKIKELIKQAIQGLMPEEEMAEWNTMEQEFDKFMDEIPIHIDLTAVQELDASGMVISSETTCDFSYKYESSYPGGDNETITNYKNTTFKFTEKQTPVFPEEKKEITIPEDPVNLLDLLELLDLLPAWV